MAQDGPSSVVGSFVFMLGGVATGNGNGYGNGGATGNGHGPPRGLFTRDSLYS